jgi:hypothetical protein
VEGRIEESIDGISPEGGPIFFVYGPSPEISLSENKYEQCAKNVENGDALLFVFAVSCQSFSD